MHSVSDVLIATLGLLASVVACLARPCRPEQWAPVKPARLELAPLPLTVREPVTAGDRISEPGFADGLSVAVT
jgi:hypothetical protein